MKNNETLTKILVKKRSEVLLKQQQKGSFYHLLLISLLKRYQNKLIKGATPIFRGLKLRAHFSGSKYSLFFDVKMINFLGTL